MLLFVSDQPVGRSKMLGTIIAKIRLGRMDIRSIRSGFRAFCLHLHCPLREGMPAWPLCQQFLDPAFRLLFISFAEVSVANFAMYVNEIVSRPRIVVERTPNVVVVVHRNRMGNTKLSNRLPNIRRVLLEGELWCVDSDNHQSAGLVLLRPGIGVRNAAKTVDA